LRCGGSYSSISVTIRNYDTYSYALFFLIMTDDVTSQNIDLASGITLCSRFLF